jgi:phosphoglycolate phosphatase/putative hydrolase of the HAD superfamily
MRAYQLPRRISALIFDMDETLYTNPAYAQLQNDCLIERLGRIRGKSFEDMRVEVEAYRSSWAAAHGGQKISLGNTMKAFGISIEEGVRWREELIEPARYLGKDPVLGEALATLGASFALGVVTNNPVLVARKTLAALGVEDRFSALVGLDTCGVSKPHRAPFLRAAELLGAAPETCVSVGDRYDIDISLPLELGMGGILVDGVEDVYKLPNSEYFKGTC